MRSSFRNKRIQLRCNNEARRLEPLTSHKPGFAKVIPNPKNPILFSQATLQHGIVVWNDSIDLDPDIAYLESTKDLKGV